MVVCVSGYHKPNHRITTDPHPQCLLSFRRVGLSPFSETNSQLTDVGWDGWGRPIVSTGAQAPAPAPMPAAAAVVDPAAQAPLMGAAGPGTRDMPLTSAPLSEPLQSSMTSTDTCWPEQYVLSNRHLHRSMTPSFRLLRYACC
jgi:hypothetical protein